jgi:hypothetical protein
MKPLQLLVLFVLALLSACDGATATARTAVDVEIVPGDIHLAVDGTAALQAVARDERGGRIAGVEWEWQSSDPSVVAVSPTGAVTGLRAGSARVTARTGRIEGGAEVSIAGPLPAACDAVTEVSVGEVYAAPAGAGALLCLPGGGQGAEYTVVYFYGTTVAGATETFQVTTRGAGGTALAGAAARTEDAAPAGSVGATEPAAGAASWEHRLREREIRELGPLLSAAREVQRTRADGVASQSLVTTVVPAIGSRMQLNTNSSRACSEPSMRTAEVVAVSERAIVLSDIGNPVGGFTPADYESIGHAFDTAIFPVVSRHFGTPSDIDGNGRTLIFFTRAVNEMTTGAGSVVGGFFFSRDLLPRAGTGQQGVCGASNEAEIVYLMVPDPARATTLAAFSRDNVLRGTLAVLAHEFQHLVNAAQRLYVHQHSGFEETWLNEAMSHVAEELVGKHLGNIGRGDNVTHARITATPQAWEHFVVYQRGNFGRLAEHLRNPTSTALFDASAPLASRGASWQFLRYAADRRGGDEAQFWRSLASSSLTGMRNLQAAIGTDPIPWMRDWTVAVYADDLVSGLDSQWRQPTWHFRSILTGIRSDRRYPLAVSSLPSDGTVPLTLSAGASAYLKLNVAAGAEAEVRTAWSDGLTPSRRLLVSIVRTR